MKKYILIIILSLTLTAVKAQRYTEFYANYLVSVPFGETADFAGKVSPRGVDIEANRFIGDDLSVGFNVGWVVFREKVTGELLEVNNLDISGIQFRYQNLVPLNLNFKKYFLMGDYSPYLGVGTGMQYAERRTDIGVFSLTDDKWLFNVAPEVGFLYDLTYSTVLSFKVKYNYSPKAGDFQSVSYLTVGLGIGLN